MAARAKRGVFFGQVNCMTVTGSANYRRNSRSSDVENNACDRHSRSRDVQVSRVLPACRINPLESLQSRCNLFKDDGMELERILDV